MATTDYGTRAGSTALDFVMYVFDLLFLEPLRWLIYPAASIEFELRRLQHEARESLHLERDKRKIEFRHRAGRHAEFIGNGFAPDSYRGAIAA